MKSFSAFSGASLDILEIEMKGLDGLSGVDQNGFFSCEVWEVVGAHKPGMARATGPLAGMQSGVVWCASDIVVRSQLRAPQNHFEPSFNGPCSSVWQIELSLWRGR